MREPVGVGIDDAIAFDLQSHKRKVGAARGVSEDFDHLPRLAVIAANAGFAGARSRTLAARAIAGRSSCERVERSFAALHPDVARARCEPGMPGGCLPTYRTKPRSNESSLIDGVGSTLVCAGHAQGRAISL